jgi:hypothetical protein
MQMYCTFVLFVNQHFPGLPTSGTRCTIVCIAVKFQKQLMPCHCSSTVFFMLPALQLCSESNRYGMRKSKNLEALSGAIRKVSGNVNGDFLSMRTSV